MDLTALLGRGVLSFVLALTGTWAVTRAAVRVGFLDRPGPRKPHPAPVPLGGGVAVAIGLTAGLAGAHATGAGQLVFGVWVLVALGLADDARDLRARTRLGGQAVAVLPAVLAYSAALGGPRPLTIAVTLVFVLGCISATNCIDCADGVAASVSIAAALALGSLAAWSPPAGPLAAAVAGAAGGFLVLNAPPARCFLGESGSTVLGFMVAVLALGSGAAVTGQPSWAGRTAAVTVLAVPILDFVVVHARRARGGARRLSDLMASAGTDHLPHRLRAAGLGSWEVPAVCAGAVVACAIAAWAGLAAGPGGSVATALLVGMALLGFERVVSGRAARAPTPVRRAASLTQRRE